MPLASHFGWIPRCLPRGIRAVTDLLQVFTPPFNAKWTAFLEIRGVIEVRIPHWR
jgi:hypothetical protein